MALKQRREVKEASLDEMFYEMNRDFIEKGSQGVDIPHFILSPTCFIKTTEKDNDRWLICDSREDKDDHEKIDNMLPCFYGDSIEAVVTKAYRYMKNG